MRVSAIIPAAGLGTRMGRSPQPEKGGTSRKQFMLLDGQPIIVYTVRKFVASPLITEVVVALRGDDMEWAAELLKGEAGSKPLRIVEGGDSRQQSVENALATIGDDVDLIAVHDAVRPFVDLELIERVVQKASETGAAIAGIVPVDTVKLVQLDRIRQTLTRERLVLSQTPQVFRCDLLRAGFDKAREDGFSGTDEASLVERLEQVEVSVVPGSDRNIKITRPADMDLARLFRTLEQESRKAS